MIDVCFSNSGAELLKFAKQELGLKSDAVLHLGGYFEEGDLTENMQIHYAKIEAETFKYYYADIPEEDLTEIYKYELKQIRTRYTKFRKYLEKGLSVRIWISHKANDYTGLYWLCNELKEFQNKLYIIILPSHEYSYLNKSYQETFGWMVEPDNIPIYAQNATEINIDEKKHFSWLWNVLVKQNTSFRILIDNNVVSADRDFFDPILLNMITETPQTQEKIMGRFLGQYGGCLVSFLSERIEKFIDDGIVEVIENSIVEDGCYWHRTIARKYQ